MLNKLIIGVSQLNFYIKSMFECDSNLKNIFVSGEISNFKGHYQSGHMYFSLKDGNSVIKAVMFASNARRIRFQLKDGMNVIVRGSVYSYEVNGQYQIYVDDIQPYGIGSYYLEFEQLKKKLSNEGLFDESRKKKIPKYPKKIGVITSLSGAAIKDIENVLKRRYPIAEIIVYPVNVQGEMAASQISEAVKYMSSKSLADVIILGRGGGASEDLWIFNDENLARTISESKIPIISAVGHETDFTICDFVSDKRAPTPSAAAELCVPSADDLKEEIDGLVKQINVLCLRKFDLWRSKLSFQENRILNLSTKRKIPENKQNINKIRSGLSLALNRNINDKKLKMSVLLNRLKSLNPEEIMKRGYSIITDENGVISKKKRLKENSNIKIKFFDGEIECKITDIRSIY